MDGKQPKVIRHDGLDLIPDQRVYGNCRPAALKDFVAYKHLPRAKPPKKDHEPTYYHKGNNNLNKPKALTSKDDSGHHPTIAKSESLGTTKAVQYLQQQIKTRKKQQNKNPKTEQQQRMKPSGKMSPKKKPKVDLTKIHFECDTSISLSSDTDLDENTPSPDKPAA